MLYVFDRGVRLDIGIKLICNAVLIEQIGDLCGDAEFDKVGIGCHKSLLETVGFDDAGDLLDRAVSVVGNTIQDETIDSHDE